MSAVRRAVVLRRRAGCDGGEVDRLVRAHGLRVVYTVYAEVGSELAARIAVQHVLEHVAEVVVVPYPIAGQGPAWQVVTWVADLVTTDGMLGRRS